MKGEKKTESSVCPSLHLSLSLDLYNDVRPLNYSSTPDNFGMSQKELRGSLEAKTHPTANSLKDLQLIFFLLPSPVFFFSLIKT